jgi:FtsZ-interacting cell division protein ZipA
MEMNIYVLGAIVFVALIVLLVILKRNRKDREEMEQSINMSEMDPEKHKDTESHI